MKLTIIAIGKKMPDWVKLGVATYLQRLPTTLNVTLVEVAATKSNQLPPTQRKAAEGRALLAHVPEHCRLVALDEKGRQWSTQDVAEQLHDWRQDGRPIALLIGGANGLSETVRRRADSIWSLSLLTMPHMLVRVVLAEQLYRAWTVLQHHPYHREG